MTERAAKRRMRVRLWQQVPLIVMLIVLWMLLWGQFTALSFATGLVVALLVTRAFYLPPIDLSGRLHPGHLAVFVGIFSWKLVVGSFQVAFQAFSPQPIRGNGVIAVQLFTRSDLIMTLTAITLSLIPGSLVLEADRERSILYLHVLGAGPGDSVDRTRADAARIERRLVRAIGSREDLERMQS